MQRLLLPSRYDSDCDCPGFDLVFLHLHPGWLLGYDSPFISSVAPPPAQISATRPLINTLRCDLQLLVCSFSESCPLDWVSSLCSIWGRHLLSRKKKNLKTISLWRSEWILSMNGPGLSIHWTTIIQDVCFKSRNPCPEDCMSFGLGWGSRICFVQVSQVIFQWPDIWIVIAIYLPFLLCTKPQLLYSERVKPVGIIHTSTCY